MENKYLIFSVIGEHAGEKEPKIFSRKAEDLKRSNGWTLWLFKSHRATPKIVQAFCESAESEGSTPLVSFLLPKTPGGASPTQNCDRAELYSENGINWKSIPNDLEVTGKVDGGAYAFVLDSIQVVESEIDLSIYSSYPEQQPIRPMPGASTICALRQISRESAVSRPNMRKIAGVARLRKPFCVYLKRGTG